MNSKVMFRKNIFTVAILTVLIVGIGVWGGYWILKTSKEAMKQNVSTFQPNQDKNLQGVLDLSEEFRILPEESYSIRSNIIKDEFPSVPSFLPRRFALEIPYRNEYSKPLWFANCNEGILEKNLFKDGKR